MSNVILGNIRYFNPTNTSGSDGYINYKMSGGDKLGSGARLIKLDNMGESAAKVANNFIDKISGALEWSVTPKGINPYIMAANKSIIEEIANRKDIDPFERTAIINRYKKIMKEHTKQIDLI